MKKHSNIAFEILSTQNLENLANIVEETIATGFNNAKSKLFTAADLWNIQRQGLRRTQRRTFA